MPSLVQLLKRRRKKLNLVEKLAGIYKSPGWRKVEDRVLGLIQLWADTFMMQEDAYPAYMRIYRELRKDGLKFPPRDPNERFMIKFEGEPSPAFELADMESQPIGSGSGVVEERKKPAVEAEETPKLLESDIQNLKDGFKSLEEILCRARDVRELQEPYSKEVIRKCRAGQKKLMWVVSYKTEMADETSVVELLGVMEFVNNKMENFKKAAGILKRGGSSVEIKELLTGKKERSEKRAPVDLLDMGEDFLEIEETNPLDALEKFVYGREKLPTQVVRKVEVEEVKREKERERERVEVKEEKKVEHRRLEQPDLLFDEPEPVAVNQGAMFDLAGLNFGTNPTVGGGYGQPAPGQVYQKYPGGVVMGNPASVPGMGNMGHMGNMGPMSNMPNMMGMPNPMPSQPVYPNPSMPSNYPYQNYPQAVPQFSNYPQVPGVQGGHLVPAKLSNQPSNDDFEDFFSEIANRKVQ